MLQPCNYFLVVYIIKFYIYWQTVNVILSHTCQVLGKSKSEIARTPLIFAYNLDIERAEKSGAQVLRVRFFLSLNRHKFLTQREISNTVLPYPYHLLSTTLNLLSL